jgi:STE24 endopeptidase
LKLAETQGSSIPPAVLDGERQARARQYSRLKRRLGWGESAVVLALLLGLILSGASSRFIGLFHFPTVVLAVIYFLILFAIYQILGFPPDYYQGFVLSRRYGISKQSLSGWLGDLGKGTALSLVFGSAAVALVFWLLGRFPDFWWLIAWALMLLVTLLLSLVFPVFLVPLFYKVRPLPQGALKARLEALAQKAGAKINGIYTLEFSAKTTAANAAVMGLGKTRRIVISDTLLQDYTHPEIEVVAAHEIGHNLNRDNLRLFVVQSVLSLLILRAVAAALQASQSGLGFSALNDPAGLPWLALLFGLLSTLSSPLSAGYTRHIESQADFRSLSLTGNSGAFKDAMTRLTNQNLAVAYPARWEEILLHDHPSYRQRIPAAEEFEKNRQGDKKGA